MWDSWMLATIHVARNQWYSAQNMAEKAYTNDRLMHREGARLIQLNDIVILCISLAESQKLHHFDT